MGKYIRLMRPTEWVKNVFVLAGLVFSGRAAEVEAEILSGLAFVAFCLAASTVYIINDIRDREQDRLHPTKRNRPIASGAISLRSASVFAAFLFAGAVVVCLFLPPGFAVILASYLVMNVLYTYWLKQRVIVDVIVIALGFVLRAVAGGVAIGAGTSPWLIVCTFTLCMFLGFGKRQSELALLGGNILEASKHRKTLAGYSPELLTHLTSVTAGIAIVTFMLYVMDRTPAYQPPFEKRYLILTLPLVVYAVFRFEMLIASGRVSGPTEILTRDKPFLLTIGLWLAMAVVVVYWGATLRSFLGLHLQG